MQVWISPPPVDNITGDLLNNVGFWNLSLDYHFRVAGLTKRERHLVWYIMNVSCIQNRLGGGDVAFISAERGWTIGINKFVTFNQMPTMLAKAEFLVLIKGRGSEVSQFRWLDPREIIFAQGMSLEEPTGLIVQELYYMHGFSMFECQSLAGGAYHMPSAAAWLWAPFLVHFLHRR